MKHFFTHLNKILMVSILLSTSMSFCQVDRTKGPTLIIASSAGGTYNQSKTWDFKIGTVNTNTQGNYKFIVLNYDNNEYLNTTLNAHIKDYNFRKVIILAGKYKTNGTINIDRWNPSSGNNTNDASLTGGITIEGEGNSTIIENTTADPVFVVKSSYNTIKNLRIAVNDNTPTTGIQLYQDYANVRRVENNLFENIYIGHWNLENVQRAATSNFVGIELKRSQYSNVGYNKFTNITLQSLYTGILLSTDGGSDVNNINDNVFENIAIKDVYKGILFLAGSKADYNTFQNIAMQTSAWTTNFVENITGEMNYFNNCKAADWNGANAAITDKKVFTISAAATQTTIANSRLATVDLHNSTDDLTDDGFNTQLFNNYHRSGMLVNKIGIDRIEGHQYRSADKGLTEIKGRLKLSAATITPVSLTYDPTFADGLVLTSDADGYATWKEAWNHIAKKNINMSNFALTNVSNTAATPPLAATDPANPENPANTLPGLRLDATGNVRIGTTAPATTNPAKLQVDGRVFIGTPSDATNNYDANYKLLVNGKVLVRNEVYVKQGGIGWADYVFAKDYKLMPLQQVEQHIQEKGYLPNMPSAAEVEKEGIAVGNIIKLQQEKIEELTLYLIEMKKQNDDLQNRMKALENNQKK